MQVIVTEPIHATPLARLRHEVEVVTWDDPRAGDWSQADAVIVRAAAVPRARIAAAPKLKVIGKHGIGVDAIDVGAARERGVTVVYTPTANVDSVAELAVGLMLALARRLPGNDRLLRAGVTRLAPPELTGTELGGKTLGLVGLGRISRRIAAIGRAGFGMRIAGYDPYVSAESAAALGITHHAALETLLAEADVISISVPYGPQTHHLIDAAALAACRPGTLLINTARGGVVDERALAAALAADRLAGAACDVFEEEPPKPDHPLLAQKNFIGTLHVGAATEEALLRVGTIVVDDVLAVLRGAAPQFAYA